MFWVVSEVVREPSVIKRAKLLKHFIKVARHCKDTKNFNSMFAIVSGLGHRSVSRLRQTWDRLGTKYLKMFEVRACACARARCWFCKQFKQNWVCCD